MASLTNTYTSLTDNKTSVSLSTMIIIKVGENPVGAIQKLSIKEARTVKMIDEVGTSGHVDSAPDKSANIGGSASRIRIDGMRLAEAFSRGYMHINSQRVPFQIDIFDSMREAVVVTTIMNVWFTDLSYDYNSDNWIIEDTANWEAERIYSYISGNAQQVAAKGGDRRMPLQYDYYEMQADTGQRYGGMDAPDLLNAPLTV